MCLPGGGGGLPSGGRGCLPGGGVHPAVDRQTPVKTIAFATTVADGNK